MRCAEVRKKGISALLDRGLPGGRFPPQYLLYWIPDAQRARHENARRLVFGEEKFRVNFENFDFGHSPAPIQLHDLESVRKQQCRK